MSLWKFDRLIRIFCFVFLICPLLNSVKFCFATTVLLSYKANRPSMGLTIWSFSGRKVLKTLEPREVSDKLEKEEITLPIGELQPLPSPSDSACSFLSRSAWKNWRSQRKFCRRSDSRWRALVRSFPPGEPGWPNSSLQKIHIYELKVKLWCVNLWKESNWPLNRLKGLRSHY